MYIKPLLVQVANGVINSNKSPEFRERYRRLKARRGHKKVIIAICRMVLTAIWIILDKLEPYDPKGFLAEPPHDKAKILSQTQALKGLCHPG